MEGWISCDFVKLNLPDVLMRHCAVSDLILIKLSPHWAPLED